jgi:hypothetical protein
MVASSERRFESLLYRKSSAGFKERMTTADNIAMIAMTTKKLEMVEGGAVRHLRGIGKL